MGLFYSRSRAVVDSVIEAGMSVVVEQVQNTYGTTVNTQDVRCVGCGTCKLDHISQNMYVKVDFQAAASQMEKGELDAAITQKIQTTAESLVKAGLGLAGSEADAAVRSLVKISQAIKSTAINVFRQENFATQTVGCERTETAIISYVEQDLVADYVIRSVTSQGAFNKEMLEIVSEIDAAAASKVEGYDPVGALVAIAVALLAGFLIFVLGGSFAGLAVAKSILASPYTWLAVLGLLAAGFTTTLAGELIGFWPYQAVDNLDSKQAAIDAKKKTNTTVTAISCIGLAASVAGIGAISYRSFF
jgi:hypothetical protein